MPNSTLNKSVLATAVSALVFCAGISGCNSEKSADTTFQLSGRTMGTTFNIVLVSPPAAVNLSDLESEIYEELEAIERAMSTYMETSELSKFNRYPGSDWFRVSAELCFVVDAAIEISRVSGGAFDVTVGPIVNIWGFGPDAREHPLPNRQEISRLLLVTGPDRIDADCHIPAIRKTHESVYVDLSAIAKGYGVDRVADLAASQGISDYLVEIGGEIRLAGHNQAGTDWSIAIESPVPGSRIVHTILALTDTAIASSGSYRNFVEHEGKIYAHTIDPRSGFPVEHNGAAVSVIAKTAMMADAMATAILVLGPDEGLSLAEREGIATMFLIRSNGKISEKRSSTFPAGRK